MLNMRTSLANFYTYRRSLWHHCRFYANWRSWWTILAYFMPTEDLGDPFLLILCLLKILATHSCWFYALCLPKGKLFILVSFQFPKIIVPVTFQNASSLFRYNFQNVSFLFQKALFLFYSKIDGLFLASQSSLWFV